jgi:archaellum component FlaC
MTDAVAATNASVSNTQMQALGEVLAGELLNDPQLLQQGIKDLMMGSIKDSLTQAMQQAGLSQDQIDKVLAAFDQSSGNTDPIMMPWSTGGTPGSGGVDDSQGSGGNGGAQGSGSTGGTQGSGSTGGAQGSGSNGGTQGIGNQQDIISLLIKLLTGGANGTGNGGGTQGSGSNGGTQSTDNPLLQALLNLLTGGANGNGNSGGIPATGSNGGSQGSGNNGGAQGGDNQLLQDVMALMKDLANNQGPNGSFSGNFDRGQNDLTSSLVDLLKQILGQMSADNADSASGGSGRRHGGGGQAAPNFNGAGAAIGAVNGHPLLPGGAGGVPGTFDPGMVDGNGPQAQSGANGAGTMPPTGGGNGSAPAGGSGNGGFSRMGNFVENGDDFFTVLAKALATGAQVLAKQISNLSQETNTAITQVRDLSTNPDGTPMTAQQQSQNGALNTAKDNLMFDQVMLGAESQKLGFYIQGVNTALNSLGEALKNAARTQ